jgi:hypothetical protein
MVGRLRSSEIPFDIHGRLSGLHASGAWVVAAEGHDVLDGDCSVWYRELFQGVVYRYSIIYDIIY